MYNGSLIGKPSCVKLYKLLSFELFLLLFKDIENNVVYIAVAVVDTFSSLINVLSGVVKLFAKPNTISSEDDDIFSINFKTLFFATMIFWEFMDTIIFHFYYIIFPSNSIRFSLVWHSRTLSLEFTAFSRIIPLSQFQYKRTNIFTRKMVFRFYHISSHSHSLNRLY